ncbi:MAG: tetratricopeptide repeat protein [Nitrospirota bacterium]
MRVFTTVLFIILTSTVVFAQGDNFEKALSLYQKGKFKMSAKYLKEYVEKNPDPYAYYLLGYANYKMKNHSEAIKYFEESYVLDPNFVPPIPKNRDFI